MKTYFPDEKLIKQFEPPLPTNPLFLSNFFMTPYPLLCPNFKNKNPLISGGRRKL